MNAMMRAAVYHALDDIRLEDRPVPEIGPGEVLLKTLACGLCGGGGRTSCLAPRASAHCLPC